MDIKRATIDDKFYNIISLAEYTQRPELYPIGITAIDLGDQVLPLRNKTDFSPGLYDAGPFMEYRSPNEKESHIYDKNNLEIIDLGGSKDTKEFLQKNERVKEINKNILESSEDHYQCIRNDNDTPEMTVFKDFVDAKQISIKKYRDRIEESCGNYNNAVRKLTGESISFNQMKNLSKAFNMKISITVEDENPDVPNAVGEKFTRIITGGECNAED